MSLGKRLRDPWGMESAMDPHYPVPMMPHESSTKVIYTAEAQRQREKQRVSQARASSGYGRR
jgi:hypothetical protein